MQLSNIPGKLVLPFANGGSKNSIPVTSQIGITPGAASLTDGFPPLTMTPVAAGGVPPSGLDMNGILYEISAIIRWANAGGGYPFDATFAADTNVNGYPKGARIMRADGLGYWFNTVENNVTDPESTGAAAAGWVPDFTTGVAAVAMASANVTLTPAQYGKPVIVITGALTTNLNLIFPSIVGQWVVINNTTGNFTITAKTAAGTGVVVGTVTHVVSDSVNVYSAHADLADPDGSSKVGFIQVGANSVPRTSEDKMRDVVNVKDKGAAAGNTTAQNKTALQKAISDANTVGGGVIIVPPDIDYGFVNIDISTYPNFTGCTADILVEDHSVGDADGSGNKTGSQIRYFHYTAQTTPVGMHDGNGNWIRGNWHPYQAISNDSNLPPVGNPGRTAGDNRRASFLCFNDGLATWRLGQGTLAGAGYTNEELSNYVLEHYQTPGDTLPNYAPLTIERKTGNWSFGGGMNEPEASYHFKSVTPGFGQALFESLNARSNITLRINSGVTDDVTLRNNASKFEVYFEGNGVGMQIDQSSRNVGIGADASALYRLDLQNTASSGFVFNVKNQSATDGNGGIIDSATESGVSWSFLRMFASSQTDEKFKLRGDGNGYCDGAWSGGGADRAEMFEWVDGNPHGFDGHKGEVGSNRVGYSVTLVGGKIRIAEPGDLPIGVVSLTYDSLGNAAPLNWNAKFLRDEFGGYVMEDCIIIEWEERILLKEAQPAIPAFERIVFVRNADGELTAQSFVDPGRDEVAAQYETVKHSYYEDNIPGNQVIPDNAKRTRTRRRKLNLEFSQNVKYIPREERREWDAVGVLGICRVRKGQVTAPTWIKMKDVSDLVEEWLIK